METFSENILNLLQTKYLHLTFDLFEFVVIQIVAYFNFITIKDLKRYDCLSNIFL